MRKCEEIERSDSCMGRAWNNEMTFVLLARDEASPIAIRAWVAERLRLGKNTPDDPQIVEALRCAEIMDGQRKPLRDAIQMVERFRARDSHIRS